MIIREFINVNRVKQKVQDYFIEKEQHLIKFTIGLQLNSSRENNCPNWIKATYSKLTTDNHQSVEGSRRPCTAAAYLAIPDSPDSTACEN